MGYEQNFLAARKNYLTKIKSFKPSEKLTHLIEEEKPKVLAQKMDQVNGKLFKEMNTALDLFESYRITYIKKIQTQIAKESQADKLKKTLNKYGDTLGDIMQDYQEVCEKKRRAEMPPPAPKLPPKAKVDPKAGSGNAIADAAVKIMLGKVSEAYRKRRQAFLDAAIEAEKYCLEQRKQILVFHETLHKGVQQAVGYSRGGQVREAAGLKVAAQGQVNKIKAMAAGAQKKYNDLEPFFKERQLKADAIAKSIHIDIPDGHVSELAKIPQAHARLWTTANVHAATAERLAKECEHLAEDGESLQSQIVDIAGGKDFGRLFLDGAVKMAARVKTVLDKAISEAEKLEKIMIPGLTRAVKVLDDKAPAERVPAAQAYVNTNTPMVKTSMGECAETQTSARKLIEAEKSKIPAEILKGQAGKVIQQSETLLTKLVTLNAGNAKTSAPVLVQAEKLLK